MPDPLPPFSSTYEVARPLDVAIVRRPRQRYALHALLFLSTVFTTLVVGAGLQMSFLHGLPPFSGSLFPVGWVLAEPSRLLLGLPFSAALLLILLAHEMGHYVYCVRYRVNATLPFFLPAPTLIGTLGAFIRIRSPIPTRTALFDIGIAGPIAGFVVAVFTLAMALLLSRPMAAGLEPGDIQFGYPYIFDVVHAAMTPMLGNGLEGLPSMQQANLHPLGIAAWVGMFATALNLLPSGQLDGGHIVYALGPRAHRLVSQLTVLILLPLGALLWTGWLVWALMLLFIGTRHPEVPAWPPLDRGRRALALFALLMLLLTFTPAPFYAPALDLAR